MSKIYFNQADSRWANHPYPSPSLPGAIIKSGGCGPTSGAMIISSMTNETITPAKMGDLFRQTGYRVNRGTSGNAFPYIGKKWGLECNVRVKLDDAVACLKRGGMVVANVKAGSVFSTGGHFIVLAYMKDNNTIAVFDPYMYNGKFNTSSRRNKVTVSGNTVFISYTNMKNYGNYSYLYCFEPKKVQPSTTDYKNGDYVEIDTPMYYTGHSLNNMHYYDTTAEQLYINEQIKSLIKNDRLNARVLFVCYAENDSALIEIFNGEPFCQQFRIKKQYITKKL